MTGEYVKIDLHKLRKGKKCILDMDLDKNMYFTPHNVRTQNHFQAEKKRYVIQSDIMQLENNTARRGHVHIRPHVDNTCCPIRLPQHSTSPD